MFILYPDYSGTLHINLENIYKEYKLLKQAFIEADKYAVYCEHDGTTSQSTGQFYPTNMALKAHSYLNSDIRKKAKELCDS